MVGVIDIGSNSVRLLLSDKGNFISKTVEITRLADGLNATKKLNQEAILRTATAVASFKNTAINRGASKVFAFATAAVRSATNGSDFVKEVKNLCGLDVLVISGKEEALYGVTGVLKGGDGGVIDIGGASSEVIVVKNGNTEYSYSLDLGVVRIKDLCGQNLAKIKKVCKDYVTKYGKVPKSKFYGIGGTATSLASIALQLDVYDRSKVHGYYLTKEKVKELVELLNSLSVKDRESLKGLQPQRAEVMLGGAVLTLELMDYLCIDGITVSEDDNLEGFLILNNKYA